MPLSNSFHVETSRRLKLMRENFRYNISTGDARVVTNDFTCYFNQPLCIPLPCELDIVWDRPTWYVST